MKNTLVGISAQFGQVSCTPCDIGSHSAELFQINLLHHIIIYCCIFSKCLGLHDTYVIAQESVNQTHVVNYGAKKVHQKLKKKSQMCAIHIHNYLQFEASAKLHKNVKNLKANKKMTYQNYLLIHTKILSKGVSNKPPHQI